DRFFEVIQQLDGFHQRGGLVFVSAGPVFAYREGLAGVEFFLTKRCQLITVVLLQDAELLFRRMPAYDAPKGFGEVLVVACRFGQQALSEHAGGFEHRGIVEHFERLERGIGPRPSHLALIAVAGIEEDHRRRRYRELDKGVETPAIERVAVVLFIRRQLAPAGRGCFPESRGLIRFYAWAADGGNKQAAG